MLRKFQKCWNGWFKQIVSAVFFNAGNFTMYLILNIDYEFNFDYNYCTQEK